MDMRRFLDLYIAETQEHLRSLSRDLLALEAGAGDAVDGAFRSAHTIKGLSAAMGYGDVAQMAHKLEDTLAAMRDGSVTADAALIDSLLSEADALDHAVTHAVANLTPQLDGGAVAAAPVPKSATSSTLADVPLPEGTARIALITLREDAPVKSARAMLIVRGLAGKPALLGSYPTEYPEDFDGVLRLFFSGDVDEASIRETVIKAGDIESVQFFSPGDVLATEPAAPIVVAPAPAVQRPTRHVRVDEARLDGVQESLGELSILQNRLHASGSTKSGTKSGDVDVVDRMRGLLSELQLAVLTMRMVPLSETFERLPRVVRDAARACEKEVDFRIEGDEIEMDRSILNELTDPLVHMLRNSVDHGIESPDIRESLGKPRRGQLLLRAERERNSVRVVLTDDGRGVDRDRIIRKAMKLGLVDPAYASVPTDEEIFRLLAHPGFSTAEQVTEVSGRGVGLDAVVNRVRALGGAVEMHSVDGEGTTFVIRLPISLALAQALRVRVAGENYAIPLTHVAEAIELDSGLVENDGREFVRVRDDVVPVIRLRHVLRADRTRREGSAVIAEMGERRVALAVDELVGREQILVKNFDSAVGTLPYFSGATLLDDGTPALVLDPLSVM
jgi:two-component system chemotaxis sensor kinase CheA